MARDGVGETERQLRVRPAADRDEDAPDLLRAALLDDRDVARRVAHDLVDGRREDGRAVAVAAAGRAPAPAEDDEVGLLLGRRLDDALGGVPADAHDRVDGRPVRGVVEDALEEPPGVAGAGRALGQRHPLGDLDDPERGQLAGALVEHRGAEPDQLLRRHRVGDRDEDPRGERRLGGHRPGPDGRPVPGPPGLRLVPAAHEVRLQQLELARLALDALLGLLGRHVAVLDDEAGRPARSRSARARRRASRATASGRARR